MNELGAFEIIIGLLGTTGFVSLVQYVIAPLVLKLIGRKDKLQKTLLAIDKIHESLNRLKKETASHRVVVLKAENGGGIPQVDKHMYASVLYEAFDNPLGSLKARVQKVPLDEAYVHMLIEVNKHGFFKLQTEKFRKSFLKDLLASENVVCTYVYKIKQSNKRFIYLSVNFTEDITLTAKDRNEINFAVNEIRNAFNYRDI